MFGSRRRRNFVVVNSVLNFMSVCDNRLTVVFFDCLDSICLRMRGQSMFDGGIRLIRLSDDVDSLLS